MNDYYGEFMFDPPNYKKVKPVTKPIIRVGIRHPNAKSVKPTDKPFRLSMPVMLAVGVLGAAGIYYYTTK